MYLFQDALLFCAADQVEGGYSQYSITHNNCVS